MRIIALLFMFSFAASATTSQPKLIERLKTIDNVRETAQPAPMTALKKGDIVQLGTIDAKKYEHCSNHPAVILRQYKPMGVERVELYSLVDGSPISLRREKVTKICDLKWGFLRFKSLPDVHHLLYSICLQHSIHAQESRGYFEESLKLRVHDTIKLRNDEFAIPHVIKSYALHDDAKTLLFEVESFTGNVSTVEERTCELYDVEELEEWIVNHLTKVYKKDKPQHIIRFLNKNEEIKRSLQWILEHQGTEVMKDLVSEFVSSESLNLKIKQTTLAAYLRSSYHYENPEQADSFKDVADWSPEDVAAWLKMLNIDPSKFAGVLGNQLLQMDIGHLLSRGLTEAESERVFSDIGKEVGYETSGNIIAMITTMMPGSMAETFVKIVMFLAVSGCFDQIQNMAQGGQGFGMMEDMMNSMQYNCPNTPTCQII